MLDTTTDIRTPMPTATLHVGASVSRTEVTVAAVGQADGDWYISHAAGLPFPSDVFEGQRVFDIDRLGRTLVACWRLAGVPDDAPLRLTVDGPDVSLTRRPDDDELLERLTVGLPKSAVAGLNAVMTDQMVMAAPRDFTGPLREMFRPDRFQFEGTIPAGFAAAKLVPTTGSPSVLVISDGERTTVALVSDGRADVVRTVDGGEQGVAVARHHEGDALPREAAAAVGAHIVMAVNDLLTLSTVPPTSVWLAGPTANLLGLAEQVTEGTGLATGRLSSLDGRFGPSALTGAQQRSLAPRLVASVGAALLGAQGSKARLP